MARTKNSIERAAAQGRFLPGRFDAALGMLLRRRRRHSYQPRAVALGVSPERRFPALKARFIPYPGRDRPNRAYEAGRWPAVGKRGYEPRAIALGWYEPGRWPESSGVCSRTRMENQGARYMSVYILLLYRRCFSAPLARLSKNSVMRPEGSGAKPKPVAPDIALGVWLADDAPVRSSQLSAVGCQYRPPTQTRSNGNASEQQQAERYQEQDAELGHLRISAITTLLSGGGSRASGMKQERNPAVH
jgi:hypothetical protein